MLQKSTTWSTKFKDFPDHAHLLLAEPGWEDVAEYVHETKANDASVDQYKRLGLASDRFQKLGRKRISTV